MYVHVTQTNSINLQIVLFVCSQRSKNYIYQCCWKWRSGLRVVVFQWRPDQIPFESAIRLQSGFFTRCNCKIRWTYGWIAFVWYRTWLLGLTTRYTNSEKVFNLEILFSICLRYIFHVHFIYHVTESNKIERVLLSASSGSWPSDHG